MLYIKALHIIFVVTWFAGLFYIVRLFIYHTEAETKPEQEKRVLQQQFQLMERRLWYGITWPSAILTFVFGFWMLGLIYGTHIPSWLWVKIAFVAGLFMYHLRCGKIFRQLQKNVICHSSTTLRLWNEIATLFLVAIVFLVVLKSTLSMFWGTAGLAILAAALTVAVKLYRKARNNE